MASMFSPAWLRGSGFGILYPYRPAAPGAGFLRRADPRTPSVPVLLCLPGQVAGGASSLAPGHE